MERTWATRGSSLFCHLLETCVSDTQDSSAQQQFFCWIWILVQPPLSSIPLNKYWRLWYLLKSLNQYTHQYRLKSTLYLLINRCQRNNRQQDKNFTPWQARQKGVRVYVNNITVGDVKEAVVISKWVSNRISCSGLSWSLKLWCFQIFPGKDPLSTCSSHLATCREITENNQLLAKTTVVQSK